MTCEKCGKEKCQIESEGVHTCNGSKCHGECTPQPKDGLVEFEGFISSFTEILCHCHNYSVSELIDIVGVKESLTSLLQKQDALSRKEGTIWALRTLSKVTGIPLEEIESHDEINEAIESL